MRLNGWQRLWIVLSVVWMGYMLWYPFVAAHRYGLAVSDLLWIYALIGVIVPVLVYGAGMVVAWVMRGFRSQS